MFVKVMLSCNKCLLGLFSFIFVVNFGIFMVCNGFPDTEPQLITLQLGNKGSTWTARIAFSNTLGRRCAGVACIGRFFHVDFCNLSVSPHVPVSSWHLSHI